MLSNEERRDQSSIRAAAAALLGLALGGALSACPNPDACASSLGDSAKPIELELVVRTSPGGLQEIADGGSAPMLRAPQGGLVMFAGPRARNLDGCGVEITAALEDPCSGKTLSQSAPKQVSLVKAEDGWGVPQEPKFLQHFAHLPLCPSSDATRNVNGEPYRLRLHLKDGRGREAEAVRTVLPSCGQPGEEDFCRCTCNADFDIARQCHEQDAGHPFTGCAF